MDWCGCTTITWFIGLLLVYFSWVSGLHFWPGRRFEEQVQSISSLFPQKHWAPQRRPESKPSSTGLEFAWLWTVIERWVKQSEENTSDKKKKKKKHDWTNATQFMGKMKLEQRVGKKLKTAVFRMIWKKVRSMKSKIPRREDTGEGCIGNKTEYMRGNMMQWGKLTKHSLRFDTILQIYCKFIIFQQVFVGSVWINWMLEINLHFLLTHVELESTFLCPLQMTTIKSCNR